MTLSIDEAIQVLRRDPKWADLVRDAYFDADVRASGDRFSTSAEFQQVLTLLGSVQGKTVVDIGAGTGIASYAFATHGAAKVYAVEPDASPEVGRGAIERIRGAMPIETLEAFGDSVPLPDQCADIVYGRQVLHHVRQLPETMHEFYRLLKPDGILLMCREHVVDDDTQLQTFLANHPIHQLAGGENAYPLGAYLSSIQQAGFTMTRVLEPWDSVINAFPTVRTPEELQAYPETKLRSKLGGLASVILAIPGARDVIWQRIRRPAAGRMYTFLARKTL